ncbi:MAG: short-chain fatty acid transporter [Thermoanaerobaculia bacterium]|jgi:short-chain fatty acids transporter|nr:short-chain fatty acid transporter [Thermoanaerobaculia bacterium]
MPRAPLLARAGSRIADVCERWFPDAFVFALAAIVLVFIGGMATGVKPVTLATEFGNGFWSLVNFTMQMAMVIVGGFVVASSPPVARLTRWLASIPKTARGAVAFVAAFAMLSSLLSWGLSLVFTGLLVREIVKRIEVDYRAIGAAAYLGLGSVWALGLSSSAALLQATKSSIPPALLPITGVIPLTQTIFLWQSMAMAAVLVIVSVIVAYVSAPREGEARTAKMMGVEFRDDAVPLSTAITPAERFENSPILNVVIALLMFWFLITQFRDKGGIAALDLNNFNFFFIAAGLLMHWTPRSFLRAVTKSVPATAGVLIQFPFYGGIFGMISKTPIAAQLAHAFVGITTKTTFPIVVAIYSAILGMFVPSGGGKWIVEAPYVMAAARQWGEHLGWTVQIYNAAEALPNLINPFWMLPLMGILNVRARDLAGYSILQLLFHAPIVMMLCWLLAP